MAELAGWQPQSNAQAVFVRRLDRSEGTHEAQARHHYITMLHVILDA